MRCGRTIVPVDAARPDVPPPLTPSSSALLFWCLCLAHMSGSLCLLCVSRFASLVVYIQRREIKKDRERDKERKWEREMERE